MQLWELGVERSYKVKKGATRVDVRSDKTGANESQVTSSSLRDPWHGLLLGRWGCTIGRWLGLGIREGI
jgi:hypothetical protein